MSAEPGQGRYTGLPLRDGWQRGRLSPCMGKAPEPAEVEGGMYDCFVKLMLTGHKADSDCDSDFDPDLDSSSEC